MTALIEKMEITHENEELIIANLDSDYDNGMEMMSQMYSIFLNKYQPFIKDKTSFLDKEDEFKNDTRIVFNVLHKYFTSMIEEVNDDNETLEHDDIKEFEIVKDITNDISFVIEHIQYENFNNVSDIFSEKLINITNYLNEKFEDIKSLNDTMKQLNDTLEKAAISLQKLVNNAEQIPLPPVQ